MNNVSNYNLPPYIQKKFDPRSTYNKQDEENLRRDLIETNLTIGAIRNKIINNLEIQSYVYKDKLMFEVLGKRIGKDIIIYRSSIIKFFAKLFNASQLIKVNDKEYVVSKKSLREHFKSIQQNPKELALISDYNKYFNEHRVHIVDQVINNEDIKPMIDYHLTLELMAHNMKKKGNKLINFE